MSDIIWMIEITTSRESRRIAYDYGWFDTKKKAQAKIAELENGSRADYEQHVEKVKTENALAAAEYRKDMEDYEFLVKAGRDPRKPKRPAVREEISFSRWKMLYYRPMYQVIEIERLEDDVTEDEIKAATRAVLDNIYGVTIPTAELAAKAAVAAARKARNRT